MATDQGTEVTGFQGLMIGFGAGFFVGVFFAAGMFYREIRKIRESR